MKSFFTLLKREFWEHRGAFWIVPLSIGGVLVFLTISGILGLFSLVTKINGQEFALSSLDKILPISDPSQIGDQLNGVLLIMSAMFNMVLFFIVLFYFLGSLAEDRKDRSILFWRSLPVSDFQTVLSKLVSGTLMAPLLMIIAVGLTQIIIMVIYSFLFYNADLSPWTYLWGPADPVELWLLLCFSYLVQALWMLPIWGWLLLVSSWAKGRAFLWAVLPIVLVGYIQSWLNFTQYLSWDLDRNFVFKFFGSRILDGVIPVTINIGEDGILERAEKSQDVIGFLWNQAISRLGDIELWLGVIAGSVLIAGAVYIRRYRDDY